MSLKKRIYFSVWIISLEITCFLIDGANNDIGRNTWAVFIDTSTYYSNYRHASNALSIYQAVKRLGVLDDRIILGIGDDVACNSRNSIPGVVINDDKIRTNLYKDCPQLDYRGQGLTVDRFLRLLNGKLSPWTPLTKRLSTDENSRILVFITGHGADYFIKFQGWEHVTSEDIALGFEEMYHQKRYKQVFFFTDSCQSGTLQHNFRTPNIVAFGCSKINQSSYSHLSDDILGTIVSDQCTYHTYQILQSISLKDKFSLTIDEFFQRLTQHRMKSELDIRTDLFQESISQVPITQFFGSVKQQIKFVGSAVHEQGKVDDEAFPLKL